ncbi:4'-phosphopantetheinyl transferase EntD (siderophore biosynthesis) [Parafrankia irregularis]|uniref:4'-phosphopantetheinyl transferase EntD (Siderophore biosynthesis) n=1 Tax=Parafrankia irregularis TaxID=795642 RepID=A0A0S4QLC1_9ACTN|nr:4'-phosphopantetheinyl transferase superfamily protein [Parafrankia irregularis]CUU56368.1 4'-phosphopantetheinyl transferase EntD (siderophore biosynthesis) [Parafrankia irregularis]
MPSTGRRDRGSGAVPPAAAIAGGAVLLGAVLPAPGPSADSAGPGDPALAAVEKYDDDFGGDPDAALFPAEAAVLTRAVDKRRREFTTGRICAHRALRALGEAAVPILPGEHREPRWPDGVVGSITHTAGYRAAVVARTVAGRAVSVGIDAEPNEATPGGVLREISLPDERDRLTELGRAHPAVAWDRLLFSAKESVYKAWFPLARRWLGFGDADLTLTVDGDHDDDPGFGAGGDGLVARGGFQARLLVAGPTLPTGEELTGFTGRWVVGRGLLVTAIAFGC